MRARIAEKREVAEGTLGGDFDRGDRTDIQAKLKEAETAARDEAGHTRERSVQQIGCGCRQCRIVQYDH